MTKYELTALITAIDRLLELDDVETVRKVFKTLLKDMNSAAVEDEKEKNQMGDNMSSKECYDKE